VNLAVHGFEAGEASGRMLADALGAPFGLVTSHLFPDGELLPTVPEPAATVIVCRSLDRPNDKLIELVLASEAWRRLGARRLVLVAPYLAYMRQDTAFQPGQAVSQRAVARLIAERFDRVLTVNAHLHRIHDLGEVFANTEAQDLSAAAAICSWLSGSGWIGPGAAVIGPDSESAPLAGAVAEPLGLPWLVFAKHRRGDRNVEVELDPPQDLRGRPVIIVDDICSSGATLLAAIERVRAEGAADVRVVVVHALFSEATQARILQAGASAIVSTDSVPHPSNAIALAGLLADALKSEIRT
jgi:ribose-phosphate pyrophosphokinase